MLGRTRLVVATLAAAVLTVIIPATTATASPVETSQVASTVSGAWVTTTPWPSTLGSLSGIAGARCGDASRWPEIARANDITQPKLLQIGVRLWVPCATGAGITPAPTPRVAAPRTGWVSPLASYSLTSCFGWRKSTSSYHRGLDMAAPKGTIRAAAAGTVTRVGWIWGGYGISTVISHGGGRWSHYAHQSSTSVRVGQRVSAGQPIGRVGNTGFVIASRNGDGSHLHFEVATTAGVLRTQINPAPFLRARGVAVRGCWG